MKVLVTGNAGFIGSFIAERLLERGDTVIGIDNLNDYYDVELKKARLKRLKNKYIFKQYKADISDPGVLDDILATGQPDRIIHLAAQAGVRYSLENPHAYIQANILGYMNLLEACRNHGTQHLVYASTSSVYGGNTHMPFSVSDNVDHPLSLYAATKKSNELMAHTYSHLFGIPTTGLRFFTVYGPWGRPDMALFQFTKKILAGEPIDVFNYGKHKRDFTYVDDIVEGVLRVLDIPPEAGAANSTAAAEPNSSSDTAAPKVPYKIFNIGSNNPVELLTYIEYLENALGVKATKNFLPMQAGDVPDTYADVDDLIAATGYKPDTSVELGVQKFVHWYKDYYA
ncbi:MAG: NAD-dependent epimerase [Pseudomonadales bacterium]|nr:NAD-dependent epimerase [Pseudomonadales bacterium]